MENILSQEQWLTKVKRHTAEVEQLTSAWRNAKDKKEKHPVIDFLFRYYSFRYNHLKSWTPGFGVKLESPSHNSLSEQHFEMIDEHLQLKEEKFPTHRLQAIEWTLSLLETTVKSQSCFSCYGLHEWAMVYKADKIRHEYTSLRLPAEEINKLVEEKPLNCTHYDALRFYTPEARPLNKFNPTRDTQIEYEQSACLHANMDLYKWAYKMYPWISSELLLECFKLAFQCREIDMKASPYDLRYLGYEPIKVETPEGREIYVKEQLRLKKLSEPVRQELIVVYNKIKTKILHQK